MYVRRNRRQLGGVFVVWFAELFQFPVFPVLLRPVRKECLDDYQPYLHGHLHAALFGWEPVRSGLCGSPKSRRLGERRLCVPGARDSFH